MSANRSIRIIEDLLKIYEINQERYFLYLSKEREKLNYDEIEITRTENAKPAF